MPDSGFVTVQLNPQFSSACGSWRAHSSGIATPLPLLLPGLVQRAGYGIGTNQFGTSIEGISKNVNSPGKSPALHKKKAYSLSFTIR